MIDFIRKYKLEWAGGGGLAGIIITIILIKSCTHNEPKLSNCDSVVVKHDTVYLEKKAKVEEDVLRPLPAITKFKVSDVVCAWDKWTGVVLRIDWSENDPNILIYEVNHYEEGEDGGWVSAWYYDTQLEHGKCH